MAMGTLYLVPTTIGDSLLTSVLPESVRNIAASLNVFVTENPKTARQFLKQLPLTTPLQEISLFTLNQHTGQDELEGFLRPALAGRNMGLMSEAGCPAVADPGAQLVRLAHRRGIRVVPLVGPSSILLALMASGMNGQSFAFHGYLPIQSAARRAKIAALEKESAARGQTQLFIEAPYRNQALFEDILQVCTADTELCLATDLTLPTEKIETLAICAWRGKSPEFCKKPTLFLLYHPKNSR